MKVICELEFFLIFFFSILPHFSIDWNKDFKPGPLPTTEEERRAAAKKYGLLPEEYRTYENDGKTLKKHPNAYYFVPTF